MTAALRADVRRIVPLAWPVLVGQLAVLAFSTVDTVMVARLRSEDLAALAVGSAVYITVFVGLMGVVLAVGPIAGRHFGAGRTTEAGAELHQAFWLALGLSVPGCALLWWPAPFLALSQAAPEVEAQVRGYLRALAFALPPALLFTAFRGFGTAVSRPAAVMAIQLGTLALKVPLNAVLVFGAWGLPALGAEGCGIATAIAVVCEWAIALVVLRRDPFYRPFGLRGRWAAPRRESLAMLLRLGIPMGLAIGIEVSGFTSMALFIARLGTTPVAGHQIAANLVSTLFMVPLAIASATSALVAQRLGAGDAPDARRLGRHGLVFGLGVAAVVGGGVFLLRDAVVAAYTDHADIAAAALPLLAWVMVFHLADAAQTIASFTLRAHHVATAPLAVYALAIWGVGLGGGYLVAFDPLGIAPAALHGARGFWAASTTGLTLAATALVAMLAWVARLQAMPPSAQRS